MKSLCTGTGYLLQVLQYLRLITKEFTITHWKLWILFSTIVMESCKHLKYRFEGIGPANCPLALKKDKTFLIVNASNSDQPGTYWLLFARADGQVFFADPLGQKLTTYPNVYKYARRFMSLHDGETNLILMNRRIQSANSLLCGLYCVYVAHLIITSRFPLGLKTNDHDMMRFAKHMLI